MLIGLLPKGVFKTPKNAGKKQVFPTNLTEYLRAFSFLFSQSFFWYVQFQKQPLEVFYEKGVLKNFAIFTGKHLCWRLQHRSFPVNIAKFLRTAFLRQIPMTDFDDICVKDSWIMTSKIKKDCLNHKFQLKHFLIRLSLSIHLFLLCKITFSWSYF